MKKKMAIFYITLVLMTSSFFALSGCRGIRIIGFYYGNNCADRPHRLTILNGTDFWIERSVVVGSEVSGQNHVYGNFIIRRNAISFSNVTDRTVSGWISMSLNDGMIVEDGKIELEFEGATQFIRQRRN